MCECVLWMCRCKVLFERFSLDLMGKRRVGEGERGAEIVGGGGGVAGL